jgi:hypothetical protein
MAEPFKQKQKSLERAESITGLAKEVLNKKKKPVKFTWKGFANLASGFLETNPFDKLKLDRIKELQEGAPEKEKDYIDFFEDLEKGLYGGVQDLGYAIGDLLTSGIDAAAGTDLSEKLTEVYEENKIKDPETLTGSVTKVLTQYGIPGGAAFKILNRFKIFQRSRKLADTGTKLQKASQIAKRVGYMSSALAATDFVASAPDKENLFVKEESTEGLSGRDLALARLRNRVRFGAEGALFGMGFSLIGKPVALGFKYGIFKPGAKVAGIGLKAVDKAVVSPLTYLGSKTIPEPVGKALRNASSYVVNKALFPIRVGTGAKQLPKFEEWKLFSRDSKDPLERRLKRLSGFLQKFTSVGGQTGLGYQISSEARREIKAQSRTIEKYLESIEKKAYNLAKDFETKHNTKTASEASQDYYLDQVLGYLKGTVKLKALPTEIQGSAKSLGNEMALIKEKFADLLPQGDLKNFMLDNLKTYMRQSFAIFTNPNFQPDKKIYDGAKNWIVNNVVTKNKDLREEALKLKTAKMTNKQAIDEFAESLTDKILKAGKQDGADPLQVLKNIAGKDFLRTDRIIRTGEELPDAIRKLLGQEDNLKSSVLTTTSHAITHAVNKQSFDKLAKIGLDEGWLFRSKAAADAKRYFDAEKIGDVKSLGLLKSDMSKYFATPELTQVFRQTRKGLDTWIQNGVYRNILQLKVAAQYGKTVLSPVTQVRNVSSASLFPLANGHIGGRSSVSEALKMTVDDIFGAGKVIDEDAFIKNIENKIRLGVLDENIVASELKAVLQEIKNTKGLTSLDRIIRALSDGKFAFDDTVLKKTGETISKFGKGAARVYAGGDNLWKWYGHEYVKSQLRSIYSKTGDIAKWYDEIVGRKFDPKNTFTGKLKTFDEAVDEAAAWYIRNTYPTYSKVPEFVQNIRKLPFGNFVSFPAEMIRTTYNIISLGAKEATSANPKLRQMGLRRLLGAYVTLGGTGKAVSEISQALTGVTMEEVEAYKRSLSAPWEKRAQIIPINKWKGGVGKAINFSYFSPYDTVTKPIEAIFKQWQEGTLDKNTVGQKLLSQAIDQDGPLRTLLDPFLTQSIALERFTDVLPAELGLGNRGGVTKTGAKVYSDTDSDGEKISKSFVHILKGVEPGAFTTSRKLVQGLKQDVKRGGQPVSLQDEILALLSGIRIINIDVPRTMQYKITEYNRNKNSVTATEKFFSLENFRQRGPEVLIEEFKQIQEENLKVNRQFYRVLQDAVTMGVSTQKLKKIMKGRNISSKNARKLLRGVNIPYSGYEGRMKKRVDDAKKLSKELNEGAINRNYFYPRRNFKQIERLYNRKSIKPEEQEPGIFERGLDSIKDLFSEAPQQQTTTQLADIKTPPLPNTPMPMVQTARANVNPNTNLTPTQEALLSPEEKVIASRTI